MSTPNKSNQHNTRIVVVGGSYGGVACINKLLQNIPRSSNVTITLIESRDAMHHCIASYRALVQKDFAKNLWIPYTNLFPAGSPHKVVHGKVENVLIDHVQVTPTENSFALSSSSDTFDITSPRHQRNHSPQRIDFDYLVLATGSNVPSPAKWSLSSVKNSAQGIQLLDQTRRDIEQSEKIVVIGGGACGVELAGEIKYAFPDKAVTLIHDKPHLVDYPKFPNSFKDEARRYLEKQGVVVILNERVEIGGLSRENSVQRAERTIRLEKQGSPRIIQSDLQFFSIGMEVDTSIITTLCPRASSEVANQKVEEEQNSVGLFDYKTLLDPRTKAIRVKSTLQLDDHRFSHIFAIGDVSTADPVPTCMAAVAAGETAARNLIKLIIVREETQTSSNNNSSCSRRRKKIGSRDHSKEPDEDDGADGYLTCWAGHKLEDYIPIRPQMVLAMNPTGGVSHLPVVGTWFGGFAAWMVKSNDLFSGRFWRALNMPRP
ncbi:Apoptosis-inducing factor 2 [Mortierella sp. GBA30]|nr:Apoptosis-inducing factor 2 [Mortierella sp. GBA30]